MRFFIFYQEKCLASQELRVVGTIELTYQTVVVTVEGHLVVHLAQERLSASTDDHQDDEDEDEREASHDENDGTLRGLEERLGVLAVNRFIRRLDEVARVA